MWTETIGEIENQGQDILVFGLIFESCNLVLEKWVEVKQKLFQDHTCGAFENILWRPWSCEKHRNLDPAES